MPEPEDDLLRPDEIEALLNSGAPAQPPAYGPEEDADGLQESAVDAGGVPDILDPSDIEALLRQRDAGELPEMASPSAPSGRFDPAAEELLEQAEADLAAALSGDAPRRSTPPELGAPQAYQFQSFDAPGSAAATPLPLKALQDVELDLRIELGRTEMLIEEVVKLREGSVVPLDKLAGDPVDILVNGRLVARGEVLVLNDNFCVRVAEILTPAA